MDTVNTSNTFDRLKKVVADQLGRPIDDVTETVAFVDLGADSLDIVELVMAIEDEFAVEIADDDAETCKDMSATVAVVNSYLARKQ